MRVSVVDWNDKVIYASPVNQCTQQVVIDYSSGGNDGDLAYLKDLLKKNMQLNLLDATVNEETSRVVPKLVIVCPDYLIDISSLATCFREYGHHPLNYFLNKIRRNL